MLTAFPLHASPAHLPAHPGAGRSRSERSHACVRVRVDRSIHGTHQRDTHTEIRIRVHSCTPDVLPRQEARVRACTHVRVQKGQMSRQAGRAAWRVEREGRERPVRGEMEQCGVWGAGGGC